jgi:hypothetical protein
MIAMGHGSVWCDHNQFKAGIFVEEYTIEEMAKCTHEPREARMGPKEARSQLFWIPFHGSEVNVLSRVVGITNPFVVYPHSLARFTISSTFPLYSPSDVSSSDSSALSCWSKC